MSRPHRWTDPTPVQSKVQDQPTAPARRTDARPVVDVLSPLLTAELNQLLKTGPAAHRSWRERYVDMPCPGSPPDHARPRPDAGAVLVRNSG
jgi:hypothetical protein